MFLVSAPVSWVSCLSWSPWLSWRSWRPYDCDVHDCHDDPDYDGHEDHNDHYGHFNFADHYDHVTISTRMTISRPWPLVNFRPSSRERVWNNTLAFDHFFHPLYSSGPYNPSDSPYKQGYPQRMRLALWVTRMPGSWCTMGSWRPCPLVSPSTSFFSIISNSDWRPRSKGQQKMAARLIVCEVRAFQRQDFRNFIFV